MDGRELVAAIDALVDFVKSAWKKQISVDAAGRERLTALDAQVFALVDELGLALPPMPRFWLHETFGYTQVPTLPNAGIPHPYPSPEWLQMMGTLRARAERIGIDGSDGVEKAASGEQAGQARSGDAKPNGSPIVYANEKRDKWIYDQACKPTTPWQTILNRLAKIKSWRGIETIQGLRAAVNRYVQKHGVTPIPERKSGRPNARK